MKKILYDLRASQPLHGVRFHGGGEYVKAVFTALIKHIDNQNCKLEVFYDFSLELDEVIKTKLQGIETYNCVTAQDIEKLLHKNLYDVFFSGLPGLCNGIKMPLVTKFIFVIHGLRKIEKPYDSMMFEYEKKNIRNILKKFSIYIMPQYWDKKYIHRANATFDISNNRKILTVSQHSKYSILTNFPNVNPEEIKVFNSPSKFSYISEDLSQRELEKMKINKKRYFLMVSAGRWLKNNLRAVLAFDQLYSLNADMMGDTKVVMTGVSNPKIFLRHIRNKEHFVFLKYVETDTLEALYKEAHAFIYPTLNEGFGYPPIEAMKYGTLSICSAVTSVPEICGDSVLYFNPYDVMEIKNRILQSFDNNIVTEVRSKMRGRFNYIVEQQENSLKGIVNEIVNG